MLMKIPKSQMDSLQFNNEMIYIILNNKCAIKIKCPDLKYHESIVRIKFIRKWKDRR